MTQQTTIKIGPGFHVVLSAWVGEHLPSTAECLLFSDKRSMITYPSGKIVEFLIAGEQVLVRLYSSSLEWKHMIKETLDARSQHDSGTSAPAEGEYRPVWFKDS